MGKKKEETQVTETITAPIDGVETPVAEVITSPELANVEEINLTQMPQASQQADAVAETVLQSNSEAQPEKKRRGPKPGSKRKSTIVNPDQEAIEREMKEKEIATYKASGAMAAQLTFQTLESLGLDEAPVTGSEQEKQRLFCIGTTQEYFVYKKWGDLTPGWALALAWSQYAFYLIQKDRNKEKIGGWWTKLKVAYAKRKAEKIVTEGE